MPASQGLETKSSCSDTQPVTEPTSRSAAVPSCAAAASVALIVIVVTVFMSAFNAPLFFSLGKMFDASGTPDDLPQIGEPHKSKEERQEDAAHGVPPGSPFPHCCQENPSDAPQPPKPSTYDQNGARKIAAAMGLAGATPRTGADSGAANLTALTWNFGKALYSVDFVQGMGMQQSTLSKWFCMRA